MSLTAAIPAPWSNHSYRRIIISGITAFSHSGSATISGSVSKAITPIVIPRRLSGLGSEEAGTPSLAAGRTPKKEGYAYLAVCSEENLSGRRAL
jgi:hypothetical protein